MDNHSGTTRIGVPPRNYLRPLFHAWQRDTGHGYTVTEAEPAQLALALRQGDLGAAFLSPIDYARNAKDVRIVPELAALSAGESGVIRLLFRQQLGKVSKIAISPASFSSEIVLAHVVLAEKYEVHPTFVPYLGTPEDGLKVADAVLISGNRHPADTDPSHSWIDLVDEWTDITEMPFVHGLWIAHPDAFTPKALKSFIASTETGVRDYRAPHETEEEWLAEYFGYSLHDDAIAALREFLQMAFFHGVLEEMTEARFLKTE